MQPEPKTITAEGQNAAQSIANVRANVDAGMTSSAARKTARATPIKADILGNTPAFVPPPVPNTQTALSRLEASTTPAPQPAEQAPAPQPNLRESLVQRQLAALEQLQGKGARTQQIMQEQQVLDKQKALDVIDSDIAKRENYYIRQLQTLEDKGGGLKMGYESEANTLRRDRARELADLYIVRAGKSQDVETARSYANDLIAAEFEPLKDELQYTGQLYNMLANDLTDSEKMQVQQQMTEKNNSIDLAQKTSQQIYAELINAGAYTPERGQLLKDAMAQASLAIKNGQSPDAAIAKMQSAMAGVQTLESMKTKADISQGWEALNLRQQELNLSKERLAAEQQATGNTYGTLDGKPQNATQALVNSYANRLIEAETVFSAVADQFADPTAFGGVLPSIMQSGERQQYEQAKRNFVNSVLRRESGAVISDQEFKNAELQYFPQAGDKLETVLQKEKNRNTVINNFYREANVPRPVFSGDIIESNGKKYQVAEDGITLIEV